MAKKLSKEEERLIDKVIEEVKKLVKKYGYEYSVFGMNKYIKNTKEKQKLFGEIKKKEQELERLKKQIG